MPEKITIYTDRFQGQIAPETYGHFIEHLGHCIYDGIWVGRQSRIPNQDGIRLEAIEVLRQVSAPVIRWPGGYFADCYDWRDGIGPAEKRPLRLHECQPNNEEPNSFGTHEFLHLCELVGAEPNLCANTATLTAQDAMNWVEYCNYDGRTSFAGLRRQNGRAEPWRVKYWAIGNESYSLHRPEDYIQHFLLWRKYMRRVDPNIQCIASLVEPTAPKPFAPFEDWLQVVVGGIRENMEMASLHLYSGCGSGDHFTRDEYWDSLAQIEQRNRVRIESFLGTIDSIVGNHQVKLALDEWGLWHPGATMTNGCEQPCTQRDALFAARYFHLLQRYPERIGLATIAQSVNVLHALLRTDGPRTYRTPTFHVFDMFKRHQAGTVLETAYSTPQFEIENKRTVLTANRCADMVTVSTSRKETELFITMTNADLEKSYRYEVDLVGSVVSKQVECRILAADPKAHNTYENPEMVRPKGNSFNVSGQGFSIELPPCSVLALTLK